MIQENSVICGDCLDVMRDMPDNSVDLVLTDPPYGIGKKGHDGGTWATNSIYDGFLEWDMEPCDEEKLKEIPRIGENSIIWGGNYYSLPPSRCWLFWQKPHFPTMADGELAWTSFDKNLKVFKSRRTPDGQKMHPTQKPVALFKWCLENYSKPNDLIFDPFAGSFTTAIACLQTGRRYICVEKEEKYCEIGRKRIREYKNNEPETIIDGKTVVQGSLFNA